MSREILTSMFDVVEWKDENIAYIKCPGSHLHSGKNAKKDCRVNLDNAPTIFCLHASCSAVIEEANYKFRRSIWDNNPMKKREFSEEEKIKIKSDLKQKRETEELRSWASCYFDKILNKYRWPIADAFHESPFTSEHPELDSNLFLNALFGKDDILWIGQPVDSGNPVNKKNFRPVKEWLCIEKKENFTCGSTFKADSFSRSNLNVQNRPYLVIESDTLSLDDTCSLFAWLKTLMELKAVVSTGGKSIHGWFVFPSPKLFDSLKICLPEMGCDEALFKPSQPVRLPGVLRGDKMQSIIYLNYENNTDR